MTHKNKGTKVTDGLIFGVFLEFRTSVDFSWIPLGQNAHIRARGQKDQWEISGLLWLCDMICCVRGDVNDSSLTFISTDINSDRKRECGNGRCTVVSLLVGLDSHALKNTKSTKMYSKHKQNKNRKARLTGKITTKGNNLVSNYPHRTHSVPHTWLTEKVKHADKQRIFSDKWDTLQAPDPPSLTNPFQTAFLLLSEEDKFIPLVSKQLPLFFFHSHQWKWEGASMGEEGREKYIFPSELHCRNYANVLCARAPGSGRLGPAIL